MKIGILGGTFNPPHIGHIVLAKDISKQLKLDKVFFVPTNIPPHKENYNVSTSARLDMIRLAIAENETFEILDIEIERGGISYTVDTIGELRGRYPEDDFYLMVGSDLAKGFSTWKDFSELQKMVKIVVANRENYPLGDKNDFIIADITQIDISSSQIRDMVREGESVEEFVKKNVLDYIDQHKLYKNIN